MNNNIITQGILASSVTSRRLINEKLPITLDLPNAKNQISTCIDGTIHYFTQPCTFTPFASVKPCSARCKFCSETLVAKKHTKLSAGLRPTSNYYKQLENALSVLRNIPLGFSLSGLEASDDENWLIKVIDASIQHKKKGGIWVDKIMYSNANGFVDPIKGGRMLDKLVSFGLDRVEVSRHHPYEQLNQNIMRFRDDSKVKFNQNFEKAISLINDKIEVRLVCVLQSSGVNDLSSVLDYIEFANQLGVKNIVFRELSRLGDLYKENRPWKYIKSSRVDMESIVEDLWPENQSPKCGFKPAGITAGYYYYNLYGYIDDTLITFETSDYSTMKQCHESDRVHKLIFHANGNLCADWDPSTQIILSP